MWHRMNKQEVLKVIEIETKFGRGHTSKNKFWPVHFPSVPTVSPNHGQSTVYAIQELLESQRPIIGYQSAHSNGIELPLTCRPSKGSRIGWCSHLTSVLVSSKAQRSDPIWDYMRFEGVIISSHVLPLAVFTLSRTESPSDLATLGVQLLSPALGVRLFTMGYHLLIVQAVGAASAANMKTSASTSANIMLGGIAAQLYGVQTYPVISRYRVLKSVLISGYRTVELANGWAGPAITIEGYFVSTYQRVRLSDSSGTS
ncbi:hypothetical protein C8R48DRAFT_812229 [Suillus tomentosus]|nr:hypothetical protein C8R48DRAFT_812229 [Suillus tomentosus]